MKAKRMELWLCVVSLVTTGIFFAPPLGTSTFQRQKVPSQTPTLAPVITAVQRFIGSGPITSFNVICTNCSPSDQLIVMVDGKNVKSQTGPVGPKNPYFVVYINDCAFWNHVYHFGLYKNGKLVSNDFGATFSVDLWNVDPSFGPAGATVTIKACGAESQQGTQILKMGSMPMAVKSWTGDHCNEKIVAIVPNLPKGQYKIELYYGSKIISNTDARAPFLNFTIQ